jgi:hypothetical protein
MRTVSRDLTGVLQPPTSSTKTGMRDRTRARDGNDFITNSFAILENPRIGQSNLPGGMIPRARRVARDGGAACSGKTLADTLKIPLCFASRVGAGTFL